MTVQKENQYMQAALNLARRGLGRAWPNPAVGCVIVKDDIIVGRGWTADGGRPHAETQALAHAGPHANGATAYVTLEPCCHFGKTPPCTDALIAAGIKRVVIACGDPDVRVAGHGIKALRDAGIQVVTNVLKDEAREMNRGFMLKVTNARPMVTLKTATSSDGMIAPAVGKQQWITGKLARKRVHLERSLHDAVLVGIGTVLTDDPSLTTRLADYDHKIVRVILDSHLRISLESQLVKSAKGYPLWIFHAGGHDEKAEKLQKAGARLFACHTDDIAGVLRHLAGEGITRLLVEGGARVHTSFLRSGLYDRFMWFRAPSKLGGGAVNALEGHDINKIGTEFGLNLQEKQVLGEDLLEIYTRRP